MNELLFLFSLVASYTMVLLLYKYKGVTGLFVWMGFAMVLANIETVKGVEMFGLAMTLGNVVYVSTDFVTTICNEIYDKKTARKAVWYGFFASLAFTVLTQITIKFTPTQDSIEISNAMRMLFETTPRVVIASLLTYLISSYIDTGIYDLFKNKVLTKDNAVHTFFRSELSSCISQFADSWLFTIFAFAGVAYMGGNSFWGLAELALTTYMAKLIVGALDTPFLYIAKKIKVKGGE